MLTMFHSSGARGIAGERLMCGIGPMSCGSRIFDGCALARPFALVLVAGLAVAMLPAGAQQFTDPAPPVPAKLPEMAAPAAKPQAGLKFHAAPRVLAPGAVTHDWRTFLGPTHNAISTETPLLK